MKKTITHRGVVYRQVTKAETLTSIKRLARETGDKRLVEAADLLKEMIAEEKAAAKNKRKTANKSLGQTHKRASK